MHILIEDFDETFEYKELKGASDIFLTLCDKAGPSYIDFIHLLSSCLKSLIESKCDGEINSYYDSN